MAIESDERLSETETSDRVWIALPTETEEEGPLTKPGCQVRLFSVCKRPKLIKKTVNNERELHLPRALLLFVMSSLLFDVGYYFGTSFASIFRIYLSHASFVSILRIHPSYSSFAFIFRIYLSHPSFACIRCYSHLSCTHS